MSGEIQRILILKTTFLQLKKYKTYIFYFSRKIYASLTSKILRVGCTGIFKAFALTFYRSVNIFNNIIDYSGLKYRGSSMNLNNAQ